MKVGREREGREEEERRRGGRREGRKERREEGDEVGRREGVRREGGRWGGKRRIWFRVVVYHRKQFLLKAKLASEFPGGVSLVCLSPPTSICKKENLVK